MSRAPRTFSPSYSMAELLLHALVIELEAAQNYADLATQMEQCGNTEVAELFARMAELEAAHADKIRQRAGDVELPELAPWDYRWPGFEPPENVDVSRIHYLMMPHHALTLALENEKEALAFFDGIADGCTDAHIRSLAAEFAGDERQHVTWMEEWLAKYAPPDADWDYDPDPAAAID